MANILIIRLSAMGDVAMTVPIIESLHKKYSDTNITILTTPFLRPFFRNIEGVSFVDIDIKKRHKGLLGVARLFFDIKRKHKIDVVADLHDVIRTKLLRKLFCLTGTKVATINKEREEKKALTDIENKVFKQLKSTHQRYAEVFKSLGYEVIVPCIVEPKTLDIPPQVIEMVGAKICNWIGIAPFAQHKGKIYPLEKMEEVVENLSTQENVKLFIFGGGENEKNVAEKWQEKYANTYSVIGKIKLGAELDLIANLDCIVSMDSSAMHMASLVGTSVISIWGATHPYTGFLGLGQSEQNAVQIDLPCRPCSIYGNKPCVKGDYPCMNGIEPQMIIDKVLNSIKS